jgi:hypothetical protein
MPGTAGTRPARISDGQIHPNARSAADASSGTARVAELCAADWGLWRTLTANLEAVRGAAATYGLREDLRRSVSARIDALLARIEAEPKPRAWRLRSRVGERVRWYELPEDV